MAPKKGLGRGLGSLFGDTSAASDAPVTPSEFEHPSAPANVGSAQSGDPAGRELRITDVMPNPEQPRRTFEREALESLADSIRRYGVLQPITVRRHSDGRYLIIAGERRWRAARQAGLETIPAHIVEADDRLAAELALIENLQREDLNPIEEAEGYRALMDAYGLTQEDVAEVVGKARSSVSNSLRLLNLTPDVREMLLRGRISGGHARALVTLEPERQSSFAQQTITDGLSVRELERRIQRRRNADKREAYSQIPKEKRPETDIDRIQSYLDEIAKNLSVLYERNVKITGVGRQGKVEFEYYNQADLNRILEVFLSIAGEDKK